MATTRHTSIVVLFWPKLPKCDLQPVATMNQDGVGTSARKIGQYTHDADSACSGVVGSCHGSRLLLQLDPSLDLDPADAAAIRRSRSCRCRSHMQIQIKQMPEPHADPDQADAAAACGSSMQDLHDSLPFAMCTVSGSSLCSYDGRGSPGWPQAAATKQPQSSHRAATEQPGSAVCKGRV